MANFGTERERVNLFEIEKRAQAISMIYLRAAQLSRDLGSTTSAATSATASSSSSSSQATTIGVGEEESSSSSSSSNSDKDKEQHLVVNGQSVVASGVSKEVGKITSPHLTVYYPLPLSTHH